MIPSAGEADAASFPQEAQQSLSHLERRAPSDFITAMTQSLRKQDSHGRHQANSFIFLNLKDNLAAEHEHSQELGLELSTSHSAAEPLNPTCKLNLQLGFICWEGNSPSMEACREKGHRSAKLLPPKFPGAAGRRRGRCCRGSRTQLLECLCRVCTAWEEMSSSNPSLPLPALPFSPLPALLGKPLPIKAVEQFLQHPGILNVAISGNVNKKGKKDALVGATKFTPWGCTQLIWISEVPNSPITFNPACGLLSFQFQRGMVIPLKQQHFSCCEAQQSTQDGFSSKIRTGKPKGPGEPKAMR